MSLRNQTNEDVKRRRALFRGVAGAGCKGEEGTHNSDTGRIDRLAEAPSRH